VPHLAEVPFPVEPRMPNARLFVPQEVLESWLTNGRAELARDTLLLDGQRFQVANAVRFLAEVAGGGDGLALAGRVKTQAQLQQLAAEHSGESVIVGDNAYQVLEGYTLAPELEGASGDAYPQLVKLFARP
jgi:hypothetical protein